MILGISLLFEVVIDNTKGFVRKSGNNELMFKIKKAMFSHYFLTIS